MSIVRLTKETYSKEQDWPDFFDDGKNLRDIRYHLTWYVMFEKLFADPKFLRLENKLKELVKKNRNIKIYPKPEYTLQAFMETSAIAKNLYVVFIGQDPYFHAHEAMGLSFSVPHGVTIPSSLDNIFANMKKFGHIKKKPDTGNLWFWAAQGCLMLNAALTVEDNKKEAHLELWEWMTDEIIKYISDNYDGIVFVLWGKYAYGKMQMIDQVRHHVTISSHPSGLSANQPFREFPAFMNADHFGKINECLKKQKKQPIRWE